MLTPKTDLDPFAGDPGRWGHSLVNNAELLLPCLDAAAARRVVEVGAYAGDLTEVLVAWAEGADAEVVAVDPFPQDELSALAERSPRLELVREPSLAALPALEPADAVVIDGDHNHYTVSEELRLVAEGHPDLPLILLHDVGWPHGRRDDYYDPDAVPAERRRPTAPGGGLFPDEPGTRPGGLPYRNPAAQEGGEANGVLTAVEDFVAGQAGVELAVIPSFFGLGVVWRSDAPYAERLAELLAPWDRNPLLARLEANRVFHLAQAQLERSRTAEAQDLAERRAGVLRRLMTSSAFAVAERLSRLRERAGVGRSHAVVSKDEIRRVL